MNQFKAIAAILLIFGSGLGTGYLLKPGSDAPAAANKNPSNSAKKPLNAKRSIGPVFFRSLGHLNNHLELSSDQQKQIGDIMDSSRERIAEKGADFRQTFEKVSRAFSLVSILLDNWAYFFFHPIPNGISRQDMIIL